MRGPFHNVLDKTAAFWNNVTVTMEFARVVSQFNL